MTWPVIWYSSGTGIQVVRADPVTVGWVTSPMNMTPLTRKKPRPNFACPKITLDKCPAGCSNGAKRSRPEAEGNIIHGAQSYYNNTSLPKEGWMHPVSRLLVEYGMSRTSSISTLYSSPAFSVAIADNGQVGRSRQLSHLYRSAYRFASGM